MLVLSVENMSVSDAHKAPAVCFHTFSNYIFFVKPLYLKEQLAIFILLELHFPIFGFL